MAKERVKEFDQPTRVGGVDWFDDLHVDPKDSLCPRSAHQAPPSDLTRPVEAGHLHPVVVQGAGPEPLQAAAVGKRMHRCFGVDRLPGVAAFLEQGDFVEGPGAGGSRLVC